MINGSEDMEKSKVYFTDFRARLGEGLPTKLKRLMKKAGFASMDMEGKFVAIDVYKRQEIFHPRRTGNSDDYIFERVQCELCLVS